MTHFQALSRIMHLEEIIHDCVEAVDIVGYNYGGNLYAGTHLLAPEIGRAHV